MCLKPLRCFLADILLLQMPQIHAASDDAADAVANAATADVAHEDTPT
jgi:hypothetical protein